MMGDHHMFPFNKYDNDCCKALKDYMYQCEGLRNEKEQLLVKFCNDWEELKWEKDAFAKEVNRRDFCGEGYLDKKFAKKTEIWKILGIVDFEKIV